MKFAVKTAFFMTNFIFGPGLSSEFKFNKKYSRGSEFIPNTVQFLSRSRALGVPYFLPKIHRFSAIILKQINSKKEALARTVP
jgi:hypothetical protein